METWGSDELDDLLTSAAAQLYPRVARPISLPIYPLVAEQEDFDLPAGILEVSRVDVAEVATDTLIHHLNGGTWEIYGDPLAGEGKIFVNRSFSNPDHYLVVHGYGTYDLTTSFPPDIYVPFILATARAEAWRTMLSDRARFEKWMTRNQKENVSVNEISQMVNQAEQEAERQRARMFTWRKPKPARR
jgi:hypothetical protein